MGILTFFNQTNINKGITDFHNTSGALLLDVRSPREYREGHIPGSENIPLQDLDEVTFVAEDKDTAIFVYCRSGARSHQAESDLRYMGYRNVTNIGGIVSYHGELAY